MRAVLSQLMLALRADLSKALSKEVVDGPDRVIDGRPVRLTHGKQLAGGVGLKMYRAVLGGTMAGVPRHLLLVLHGLPLCSRLYELVLCPSVCLCVHAHVMCRIVGNLHANQHARQSARMLTDVSTQCIIAE